MSLESNLLDENFGLVMYHATKMRPNRVVDIDDYKQVGAIALLKVLRKFDPNKGQLSTYAWSHIKQAIMREALKFQDSTVEIGAIEPEDNSHENDFWEFLPKLDKKSTHIIGLRYIGYTFKEIGDMYGKTNQWAKIEVDKIIQRIKEANSDKKKNSASK